MTLRLTETELRELMVEAGRPDSEIKASLRSRSPKVTELETEFALTWDEKQFTTETIDLGHANGCMMVHYRAARTNAGYRTAVQGDVGSPDLTICHPERGLYVAELKAGKHWRWRPGQREWLEAAGWRGFWWHPTDWPLIKQWFTDPLFDPPPHWFVDNWVSKTRP